MNRLLVTFCLIFSIIVIYSTSTVSGRPTDSLTRHKRQSDQRLAELETLLALQKYRHRLRPDRKHDSKSGYGGIDFRLIGRKKKSTSFSPGEGEINPVYRGNSPYSRTYSSDTNSFLQDASDVDPSFNEKIDSLLSYNSILVQDSDKNENLNREVESNVGLTEDIKFGTLGLFPHPPTRLPLQRPLTVFALILALTVVISIKFRG